MVSPRRAGGALRRVGWAPAHGVTLGHWRIFRECAVRHGVYLVVRPGEAAAVPWIELGFPTATAELSRFPIDPELGVVKAPDGAERKRIHAFGHYVLTPVVGEPDAGLVAVNPGRPPLASLYRARWAAAGVVIDRRTRRPFTSGYGIAAVAEMDADADPAGWADAAGPAPAGTSAGSDRRSGGSAFAAAARRELTARIGRDRCGVGGPAAEGAGYGRTVPSGRGPRPGRLLVFTPFGGTYESVEPGPGAAAIVRAARALDRERN